LATHCLDSHGLDALRNTRLLHCLRWRMPVEVVDCYVCALGGKGGAD